MDRTLRVHKMRWRTYTRTPNVSHMQRSQGCQRISFVRMVPDCYFLFSHPVPSFLRRPPTFFSPSKLHSKVDLHRCEHETKNCGRTNSVHVIDSERVLHAPSTLAELLLRLLSWTSKRIRCPSLKSRLSFSRQFNTDTFSAQFTGPFNSLRFQYCNCNSQTCGR